MIKKDGVYYNILEPQMTPFEEIKNEIVPGTLVSDWLRWRNGDISPRLRRSLHKISRHYPGVTIETLTPEFRRKNTPGFVEGAWKEFLELI